MRLNHTQDIRTCTFPSGVVFEKSYLGSVSAMKLNALYAAVVFDGKVQLHAVSSE